MDRLSGKESSYEDISNSKSQSKFFRLTGRGRNGVGDLRAGDKRPNCPVQARKLAVDPLRDGPAATIILGQDDLIASKRCGRSVDQLNLPVSLYVGGECERPVSGPGVVVEVRYVRVGNAVVL